MPPTMLGFVRPATLDQTDYLEMLAGGRSLRQPDPFFLLASLLICSNWADLLPPFSRQAVKLARLDVDPPEQLD
jgi:hypothetical protein